MHPTNIVIYYYTTTMACKWSIKATERKALILEAVLGVQIGIYKSCYKAVKALGLSRNTVTQCIKGQYLSQ